MTVGLIHDQAYTVEYSATVFVWNCLAPGGEFSPDGLYDHSWASVTPMAGKYTTNFSQWCVCMFANFFFRGEVSFRYLSLTGNGPRPTLSGEDVGCDQEGG